ncbi:NAD(P)/FAD-dependent oxidoreductase [Allomesorhizobium camelthorni]|uniref:FAD-dependent oxidoreductase n=1 Tax=Allomesorhizobium camelthorni TaxID=475069 RepID=A0A6G4WC02_9HYPH|nr:FAD-dependent oxidoreductase [Mesorhizobium camelthorni]NGO52325.1 FAD-dependent oxidoreductase [Mesorhizobium camelthorni]
MAEAGMVIVGAGEAGTRAAFALREEGYAGPVSLIGAERHLPYERPPLSKDAMGLAGAGMKTIADAVRFEEAGIRLILSAAAISIDRAAREVKLEGGASLSYDRLLLATGARPRRLAMAENSRRCVYLRTHDDAETIRAHLRPGARVAVIGGGFIGLELAAAARMRGCAVSVIEVEKRLLTRAVPAEIAAVLHEAHAKSGVDIRCGTVVTAIDDLDDGVSIALADGASIDADACIVGIGAIPNTDLAERAGLAVENGVRVDERMATSDPHIFAAGDCCSFPLGVYAGRRVRLEAWRNAQDQGNLAARNMLGRQENFAAIPWFWSDQFDLSLQIAGLVDEGAETVRREIGEGAFILFHLAADGRLVAASGIGQGNTVARDIRLAEMLVAKKARPPRDKLAAAETKLKTLLAA